MGEAPAANLVVYLVGQFRGSGHSSLMIGVLLKKVATEVFTRHPGAEDDMRAPAN